MADYVLVHGGDVSTETWNALTKEPPIYTASGTSTRGANRSDQVPAQV
jgi:hypothetical protein